ncbi:hypothetical protein [Planctobacterium marinum]|uniref:Uncharacterized protein n=1 Tax=Planctobacterium marinum TaxID=1631968 RepID=A0AA48KTJ4_9ALTE|nr:hypothetical protein MACH26_31300 [Planctobacterium marinum]
MKITHRLEIKALMASTALLFAGNAISGDLFELNKKGLGSQQNPTVQAKLSSTHISLNVQGASHGGTISISGPAGFAHTIEFSGSSETVNLLESDSLLAKNNQLPPGRYNYQITTHVGPLKLIRDTMNNGRGENNFTYAGKPVFHSGSFIVEGGSIKQFAQTNEPAPARW